jgi:hypothetical protein
MISADVIEVAGRASGARENYYLARVKFSDLGITEYPPKSTNPLEGFGITDPLVPLIERLRGTLKGSKQVLVAVLGDAPHELKGVSGRSDLKKHAREQWGTLQGQAATEKVSIEWP